MTGNFVLPDGVFEKIHAALDSISLRYPLLHKVTQFILELLSAMGGNKELRYFSAQKLCDVEVFHG